MPEKKTVTAVVLGVSLVSLIAALIAGLADSITLLTDFVKGYSGDGLVFPILITLSEFVISVLGIVFVAMFLLRKNNRNKTLIGISIALVALAAVLLIVTKAIMPKNGFGKYYTDYYTVYTGVLASVVTVMVSTVLTVVSYMLLLKQQSVKSTAPEQAESKQVEQTTANDGTKPEN